ncbi:active regulator of SIRT1-like [Sitophilus oryzae]|uniref:Active regulator of SIRT1 n=1 Tax=Sitophilus oryzae TaxID=7048 RepID=A0A6J2XUS7_SITOR|nr:active regulator of SIRT1-like [Sitophilus oryzae]
MSAALVKQALEIVDPDFKTNNKASRRKNKTDASSLFPEHHRIIGKSYKKGKKEKIGLGFEKKLSVQEAKKQFKTKEQILKENLKKLEVIRENSKITLNKEQTKNIIERARTRRPIESRGKKSKQPKSAFTDEDFKKFEEEYFS